VSGQLFPNLRREVADCRQLPQLLRSHSKRHATVAPPRSAMNSRRPMPIVI